MIVSPPSKARRALCLFSYGIYADKFLFSGVFAHRVGKPPTYGGGGPRSGGEGGLQLYNAVFVMYVYHAPTVTPLARHLPREWEALSNTAKQEFEPQGVRQFLLAQAFVLRSSAPFFMRGCYGCTFRITRL